MANWSYPQYADYVFWLHRTNGTFQPVLMSIMYNKLRGGSENDRVQQVMHRRINGNFEAMERQLGKFEYLAGDVFTAADCMTVFFVDDGAAVYPLWAGGLSEYCEVS